MHFTKKYFYLYSISLEEMHDFMKSMKEKVSKLSWESAKNINFFWTFDKLMKISIFFFFNIFIKNNFHWDFLLSDTVKIIKGCT